MPHIPPDPAPGGVRRLAALLLAVALLVSGCALDPDPGRLQQQEQQDGDGRTSRAQAVRGISDLLRDRSRAVRRRDEASFLGTLARGRADLTQRQEQYFANLSRLPVGVYRQRLADPSVERVPGGFRAVVHTSLQLAGFDARPVVRPSRMTFARVGRGEWRLTSDRDPEWDAAHGGDLQPWDQGEIVTVTTEGVLGIFDASSRTVSGGVVAAVQEGIEDVSAAIPYDWGRSVVVYALSDTSMLRGIDNLPGEDPDSLDAVSFPVLARPGQPEVASIRFLLHPRMLDSDPTTLARLVRHELTHVALGLRDDQAPVWFAEGLAEWVSVQPLAPTERLVSGAAVAAAQSGSVSMPTDDSFNGPDSAVNYGLAWWACQAIVDMYGESMLWSMLDSYVGVPRDQHPSVLREATGLDTDELAQEAARRIVATYG